MLETKIYNCLYDQNLMGSKSSVHKGNSFRSDRAKEQLAFYEQKYQNDLDKKTYLDLIINYTNDFLDKIDIPRINNPVKYVDKLQFNDEFYAAIQEESGIASDKDIVWMKFTTTGLLGLVAVSNDINFEIPNDDNYDAVNAKGQWRYNSSGILAHMLDQRWDESFVLIFPLKNIPIALSRSDVECGIGNYLIEMGIPIMDYYSHKF
ncbi:hypothetical protein [Companilactobacillus sp. HBUAS59699]|uniref:hypothetical protein n=1 Tax=Companilactobacillus sp. HBUAS59699 TaxID=3109358 RepID=UPI002FF3379E